MVNANEKEPRSIRLQGLSECQRKEAERKQAKEWQQKQWGREETGRVRKQTYTPSTAAFTANEPRKKELTLYIRHWLYGDNLKKGLYIVCFFRSKDKCIVGSSKKCMKKQKKIQLSSRSVFDLKYSTKETYCNKPSGPVLMTIKPTITNGCLDL